MSNIPVISSGSAGSAVLPIPGTVPGSLGPQQGQLSELARSPLVGGKIMLMGEGGVGKTHSLRTLVDAGIMPCLLSYEPGFEVVGDVPAGKLAWHYIQPQASSWGKMIESAERINSLSYETIVKMQDPNRSNWKRRWVETLQNLANFTDDRTGQKLGAVETWGTNRAIVIDPFTELCRAMMELEIGEKPVASQPEWQVAQNNVENFIRQLVTVTRCWVIVCAHVDRLTDEVFGGSKIQLLSLGKALTPKLPQLFSDVIIAEREGKKFTWSAAKVGTTLKARNFPYEEGLPPSFVPAVERWKLRGGIIETTGG